MGIRFSNAEKEEVSPVRGKQLNDRTKITRHIIPHDQNVDNVYVMLELLSMLGSSRNRKYE